MPRDIEVAIKGINENPISSILIIILNLDTKSDVREGSLFLLKGIAQRIYVIVG